MFVSTAAYMAITFSPIWVKYLMDIELTLN